MDGVGTEQGMVHRQRQGTGLATVLQGDEALNAYRQVYQTEYATLERRNAERQAKAAAALAKLNAVNPEYFYKHKDEIQPAIDKLHNDGVNLLSSGVQDIFNDPRARDWQKQYSEVMAMSRASQQVKEQFDGLRKVLVETNPDEYRPQDITAAMDYFDTPLSDIVKNGKTAPLLQKKRPFTDMNEFIGKQMTAWQNATSIEPTDKDINDFVNAMAKQPANTEKFVSGYGSKFAQLEPDEQKRVKDMASSAGREVWQQLAFEDAKRWQKTRTPLDIQKEFAQAAKLAEGGIDYIEWATPSGFGKSPKKGSVDQSLSSSVNALFNSDPRWMTVFDKPGELPRLDGEDDGEYAVRVKKYLTEQIRPLVGIDTKSGQTEKGKEQKDLTKSRDMFLADIRSGDVSRMQDAANTLVGTTYVGNMKVEDATVFKQSDNAYWLELQVTTPLSVKDIKQQVVDETGTAVEDVQVEERQGKKIVNIGLSPGAIENQTLIRLHDNTFKQTGKPYDTKYTARTPNTAMGALNPKPVPQSKAGTLDDMFK